MVYLSQFVTNWIENLWLELDRLPCSMAGLNPYCTGLHAGDQRIRNWLENNFDSSTLNQFPHVVSIELTPATYR
jgi:hypothetical protein